MEMDICTAQLDMTDATFKRGRQAMMALINEATHEFDGGMRVLMSD